MKIIITGSTGMVGKAVLLEALEDSRIQKITLINRKPINFVHEKVEEILHQDFCDLSTVEHTLAEHDACFFCLGVSAIGLSEQAYSKITFDITRHFADTLFKLNPNMIFNYVSGVGTDTTEQGSIMWARVKGKTENYILQKGFKDAYMFRPGMILPEKGIRSKTGWYNVPYILLRPFFPWIKKSKNVTTTTQFGQAMIQTLFTATGTKYFYNKDINNTTT